jgi:hypothetical protein
MSCLFNSLSYFIKEDSYYIRHQICKYLENNFIIIKDLDTKYVLDLDSVDYIQNMKNISTWGGAIEIQVACNIWKLRIIVNDIQNYRENNKIEFIPINNIYEKTIELYWNESHYEPKK